MAMATHEIEITESVNLCTPDGKFLNPQAKGWSRVPLHIANLKGGWGRTKRWDYWAILAGEYAISVTYADVDYLGLPDIWWCHLPTGRAGGRSVPTPAGKGISLPDLPGLAPLRFRSSKLVLDIADDDSGTDITAAWSEKDGTSGRLEARVDLPEGHESLNVVIPWSDKRYQYTSKHQARAAHGVLEIGDTVVCFGNRGAGDAPNDEPEAWGVLDVGRGRWPYSTRWNWGGGAGTSTEGSVVGLQFGAKWTEGTGHTENGIIVDGRLNKIGEELTWLYDWDQPMKPWRVMHPDGSLDLELEVTYDRHNKVQGVVLATEVHQVFGRWSGHVSAEDGTVHNLEGVQGFAEESRSRW